jgi:hypothetical protein
MHHIAEKGTQMSHQSHTIGSPLHRFGVAEPARARVFPGTSALSLALAFLFSLAIFALSTAPARAEVVHQYLSQITTIPAEGPKGPHGEPGEVVKEPGKLAQVNSMTFDAGDLWVGEDGRVDEFNASGGFVSQLLGPGAESVAVGHANGEAQLYASGRTAPGREVSVFDLMTKAQIGAWTGAGTPSGSFGLYGGIRDVAVDNSSDLADEARGDVYVADAAIRPCVAPGCAFPPQDEEAVDVFEPQAGGEEKYVTQLTGVCPTEGITVGGTGCKEGEGLIPFPFSEEVMDVVVDQSNGDVYVGYGGQVDVFEPLALHQYRFVRQLPIGAVSAVGGGEDDGDIYAGPSQFSPAGVFLGELTGTPSGPFDRVDSVAVDDEASSPSFEDVYVGNYGEQGIGGVEPGTGVVDEFGPNVVIPDVTTTAATGATPASATLNGEVDPLQAETHEGGECWFVWGTTTAFGEKASCEPRQVPEHEGFVPVHAQLQGLLEPDTTYYYRLQANNAQNITNPGKESETQHFTTPGPGIHGESVAKVAATSATLQATIDPHEEPAHPRAHPVSYFFEYGPTTAYGSSTSPVTISPGEADVNVEQHVQENLAPGTVYYYRVVALSEIEVMSNKFETKDFYGPDEMFTTQPAGSSLVLPDDRAWELVSPPDKHGALIWPINQFNGVIQAAATGDAITYGTNSPTELQPRGETYRVQQILSTRTSGASSATGWSSQDIEPPNKYETGVKLSLGYNYRFFSPDLSLALVEPQGAFTPLEHDGVSEEVPPRASERTEYLRSDFTCKATPATCYMPIVTEANTPPGTKIGGDEEHPVQESAVQFVGAAPDLSHIVLQSGVPLVAGVPTGPAEDGNLYEWSQGRLQLVSVRPASEGGAEVNNVKLGSATESSFLEARNAISSDGLRVVWTDFDDRGLYMSDTAADKTESVRIGGAGAEFTDASSDDSKVFYTEGGDLYVFEETEASRDGGPLAGEATDLTVDLNAGESAKVQGAVLAASEDGSYVYFVADGALAAGAAPQLCSEESELERTAHEPKSPNLGCNLYVEHYDGETGQWEAPRFIATLSGADDPDWEGGQLKDHTSRSSPDGRFLAFMSRRSLTGYDNADVDEHPTAGEESEGVTAGTKVKHYDEEVYLYDAVEHKLVCASCNPTGARPVGAEAKEGTLVNDEISGGEHTFLAANVPGFTPYADYAAVYQSRYLSNSGRLFFNSHETLAPQDVNGTWDVYEYEPPGIGSCSAANVTFSPRSAGCVNLVSSGESAEESAFLDASENGDDVFFLSASKLVPQDTEAGLSVYDAHVCGAEGVPCAPSVTLPPPCTTEASCKPSPEPRPSIYGLPASATFSGPGNITPEVAPPPKKITTKTVKCKKGYVKKKVKKNEECVKKPKKKSKAKKASNDRRAGR